MRLRLLVAGLLFCLAQTGAAQQQRTYGYGPNYYYLTVTTDTGGEVSSSPNGISCPGMCNGTYTGGDLILTATPAAGYTFTGWSGDCSGTATCTLSMSMDHTVAANFTATSPAVTPETGFWYNPAESGCGYVIETHGTNLFISGFMYDANGNAVWYASGPGPMSGPSTYQGSWEQYGDGQTLTGAYKPPAVLNADVGSITLQFITPSTATLTLPDGVRKPLQRFPF